MKLIDLKVNEYLDVLKSNEPAPGGGSVSALAGAQGAALMLMVIDLTLGREKYEAFFQICEEVKKEGLVLYRDLVKAIDNDTEAYNKVSAAFKLPKESEEDKKNRSKAIAEAMILATEVPLQTMVLTNKVVKELKKVVGNTNPSASSDLGVSALCLVDAVSSAWLNVKINLSGIKDIAKRDEMENQGKALLLETRKIGEDIYNEIEKGI